MVGVVIYMGNCGKWKKDLDEAIRCYDELPWHDIGKLDEIDEILLSLPEGFNVKKYKSEVLFNRGLIAGKSLENLRGDYVLGLGD